MKSTLTLILLVLTMKTGFCQESFEGVITYAVSISFKNGNVEHLDYFAQKYGDTVKVFYNKKGDIYKNIIGSGGYGYEYILYKQDENNYYTKWKNLDTLYHYNVSEQNLEIISTESGESKELFNRKSHYLSFKAQEPRSKQLVSQTFYYNGEPYINPELFKDFIDFFTFDFFKKSQSPYMILELDLDSHLVTYKAVNIEFKEIKDKIFEVPSYLPKKKY